MHQSLFEDNEKAIQDTLYLNKADSILIIPDNFQPDLKQEL